MSERPEDGVVNAFGQAHDVPNLFVSDASQFTTGAAANPTLTIVALAIRQAEHIVRQLRRDAIPTGRRRGTAATPAARSGRSAARRRRSACAHEPPLRPHLPARARPRGLGAASTRRSGSSRAGG
jgi:choline dehydrogenase-like flavoprotein